ncbi:MAG: TatD family hydrolase [Hydrogenovibrio sp.]|uniref:TatD family hydrolase n=1 Tax=Hydrogenovibrio sp. TaxID=2065821 RepID=UPI002870A455|nr:TatD family hydrolase [Hydrogenovibrio sp.]MDR9499180.1 TatD family hydrolase [Hydrogenovibrio sp.]
MLFDTHAHLTWCFDSNTHPAQTPTSDSEIDCFLAVSITLADSAQTLAMANGFPGIRSAIGIHPWFIDQSNDTLDDAMQKLSQLVEKQKITALGEIGLDKARADKTDLGVQQAWFEAQLKLAVQFDLPVSLHCFKAWNEMLRLFKSEAYTSVRGVMHGFSGGPEMAKQFVDEGFLIGVGPIFLNQNARRYHDTVKAVGVDHIVLETDAQPNEADPACRQQLSQLTELLEAVSRALSRSRESVEAQVWRNSCEIFKQANHYE